AGETDAGGNPSSHSSPLVLTVVANADDDTEEQTALTLTVGATTIGSRAAAHVPFSIGGLDPEDTGTVTFTDANGKTLQVNVNAGQTNYSADLTSLSDGPITSKL